MHKRRARARRLRTGSAKRTGEKAWLQLVMLRSMRLWPRKTREKNRPIARSRSISPKEMLQAQAIETRLCFFAPAASGRGQPLINGSSGFPF